MYSVPIQPRQVRLELTNKCNAKCITCHRLTMTRNLGEMSKELLVKCLNDIKLFLEPLVEVVPSNFGETFMTEGWQEKLQLISKSLPRTRMVIPTNGTLLANGSIRELCQVSTLKLINLSVNAHSPEIYTTFHKLPAGNLEVVRNTARKIRELRPDITLWISMVLDSQLQSPKEVELFTSEWSKLGIVQINPAQYNNRPDRAPLIPVKLPCRSLFSDLVVLWNGEVISCCFCPDPDTDLLVGDARESPLLDIWHSRQFARLRQIHLSGDRKQVKRCSLCTFA